MVKIRQVLWACFPFHEGFVLGWVGVLLGPPASPLLAFYCTVVVQCVQGLDSGGERHLVEEVRLWC